MKCTFRGEEYQSRADVCKKLGLDVLSVYRVQHNRKVSFDEAVEIVTHGEVKVRSYTPVVVDGITYRCKKDACESYGLNQCRVRAKMKELDMPFEQALLLCASRKRVKPVVDGVEYDSIKEVCDAYGTGYDYVLKLIKGGMPLDKAVKSIYDKKELRKKIIEACEKQGVSFKMVEQNKGSKGMTFEEAFEYTVKHAKRVEVNGKVYRNKKEACDILGYDYRAAVDGGRYRKMTFNQSLEHLRNKGKQINKKIDNDI